MRYFIFFFAVLLIFALAACASQQPDEAPDLVVYYPRNGYRPPYIGEDSVMAIDLGVGNEGNKPAPAFDIKINGTELPKEDGLEPDETVRIIHPDPKYLIVHRGPYTVVVDPDNKIIELDESNNEVTAFVMTLTPPGPCPTATSQP